MRNQFDEQLEQLGTELTEMGAYIEEAITHAVKTLNTGDPAAAMQALSADSEVDQKEKTIEQLCFKLLLHQQPVAGDLRLISTALKMITDMERIGDQAADITDLAMKIHRAGAVETPAHIQKMAEKTIRMVKSSIDAFVRRDMALAVRVCESDDAVDALFDQIKNDMVESIYADKNVGAQALDMLMIAKYFERIGDHAVNIAGWVIFSITGKHGKQA